MRTVRRWGLASSGIRAMRSPTRSASERLGSQNGYLSCGGWQARVRIVKSDGKSPQHGGSHFGLEPVRVHCCSAVAPPSSSSSSSIPPSMPETDGERWGRGGILRPSPPHSPPRWRPASPRREKCRERKMVFVPRGGFAFATSLPRHMLPGWATRGLRGPARGWAKEASFGTVCIIYCDGAAPCQSITDPRAYHKNHFMG